MTRTGSTGSLFTIEARTLSAESAREESFAMPIHGEGLTDHLKLIAGFSRGQINRLGRSPKWSRFHAIF